MASAAEEFVDYIGQHTSRGELVTVYMNGAKLTVESVVTMDDDGMMLWAIGPNSEGILINPERIDAVSTAERLDDD